MCLRSYKKVAVSKEILHAFIDNLDSNGDGLISLEEVDDMVSYLYKKAMGKIKEPSTPKIRTLE